MKLDKVSLLIGLIISILLTWFSAGYFSYIEKPNIQRPFSPFMETVEVLDLRTNDIKFKLKAPEVSQAPVALVAIDDASVREIGRWPWSREQISEMTQKLVNLGAQSVAFDVIFSEPELGNEQADRKLAEVVEAHPDKIILGTFSESQLDYKPYQDLCVAEAFLATGGDQLVKLNPGFTMDETTLIYDDLNWGPVFQTIFKTERAEQTKQLLASLGKTSEEELTRYQRNNLVARQNKALFNYCQKWLTKDDPYLTPEVIKNIRPLYFDVVKEQEALRSIPFEQLLTDIPKKYKGHPIPQYGEWTSNISAVQTPASYTASFIAQLDSDGYVRRYPLFFRSGNKLGSSFIPSLALQGFLLSGPYRAELKMEKNSADEKYIESFKIFNTASEPETQIANYPVDRSGQVLINYYGRQMSLPYISAKDLFNDNDTIRVYRSSPTRSKRLEIDGKEVSKAEFFKGRSLIVGATAVGLYDLRNTPVEANYPGPELHLTMLANMIENNFLKSWPSEGQLMPWIILGIGILLTLVWSLQGSLTSLGVFIIVFSALMSFDLWLFLKHKILLHTLLLYFNLGFVFFAIQLYRYFTEEKKKRELKSTFSKYVSPAVVDELLKDAKNLKLGGKKEHMTVFFSDVRGFTTISEKLAPEELSRVLNLYLTPMTEIVFKNNGTLDKYMGDAIMAFFGAPVKHSQHAQEACRCALESLVKLKELQQEFEQQGLPHIDIGIGINTGDMSVGNMGSNIVQNYTVMGDSVNLASRLEGINKEYGTRIVISEFTYEEVKKNFTAREIDRVRVKGKLEPVRIFELLCEGSPAAKVAEALQVYQKGYDLYQTKEFAEALESFKVSLKMSQDDPVSELYIERCEQYLKEPPPQDWDGVFVMKTK